ncbi:hypothetical protein V6N13_048835 [Hibiscus sabdariffa]
MARLRKVMLYGKEFERSQCRKESTYLFGLSFTIICSQMWLCGDKPEDLDHVLRSCAMVRSVWLRSIPVAAKALFSALNFKEWLYMVSLVEEELSVSTSTVGEAASIG